MGQAFDKLVRAFHEREKTILEEDTLHSALSAQLQLQRKFGQRRNENVKRLPPVVRNRQLKNTESQENTEYGRILEALFDLKPDVGTIKKSLDIASRGNSQEDQAGQNCSIQISCARPRSGNI